jgi:cytochrome P450
VAHTPAMAEALADFRIDSEAVARNYDDVADYLLSECPVMHSPDGYVVLSRDNDVRACASDASFITGGGTLRPRPDMVIQYPMESDPPLHTRLRRAMMPYFSSSAVARYGPLTEAVTHELVDAFPEGGCESVRSFCRPLPGLVVFRGLLGLPDEMIDPLGKALYDMLRGQPGGGQRYQQGVDEALRYHRDHQGRSGLMQTVPSMTVEGEQISHEVQHSIVSSLILGGLETTTSVLAQAVYYLGTHPSERDALTGDLSRMDAAVDESLRLFAPAVALGRTATEACQVGEHSVEPGDFVYLGWGPACRDPRIYDRPREWDMNRDAKNHLAFGFGRHRCIGGPP